MQLRLPSLITSLRALATVVDGYDDPVASFWGLAHLGRLDEEIRKIIVRSWSTFFKSGHKSGYKDNFFSNLESNLKWCENLIANPFRAARRVIEGLRKCCATDGLERPEKFDKFTEFLEFALGKKEQAQSVFHELFYDQDWVRKELEIQHEDLDKGLAEKVEARKGKTLLDYLCVFSKGFIAQFRLGRERVKDWFEGKLDVSAEEKDWKDERGFEHRAYGDATGLLKWLEQILTSFDSATSLWSGVEKGSGNTIEYWVKLDLVHGNYKGEKLPSPQSTGDYGGLINRLTTDFPYVVLKRGVVKDKKVKEEDVGMSAEFSSTIAPKERLPSFDLSKDGLHHMLLIPVLRPLYGHPSWPKEARNTLLQKLKQDYGNG